MCWNKVRRLYFRGEEGDGSGGLVVEVTGGSQVVEGGSEGAFVVVSRSYFRGFVSKGWKGDG